MTAEQRDRERSGSAAADQSRRLSTSGSPPPAAGRDCEEQRRRRRRSRSGGSSGAAAGGSGSDGGGTELTELQLDALPWHEMQLHLMFGRRFASDVIHPPMELHRQAKFKNRMRQLEGRTGAKALWSTLRDSSHKKLLCLDDRIPGELKRTYGAFVRQLLLQNGLVPAKRNFTAEDDVEKIELLLDKSMTLRVKDKRHKVELMSRSSKVNADRMQILAYNSSFPDLVNSSGEEGIDRYLPSWSRQQASTSAVEGRGERSSAGSRSGAAEVKAGRGLEVRPDSSLLAIEASLSAPRQQQRVSPSERVHFLTEREAVCEGRFSSRFHGLQRERNSMVKPADDDDDDKNGSSPPAEGAAAQQQAAAAAAGVTAGQEANAQRHRPRKHLPANYRPWQPLTLKALVEYSQSAEPTANGTSDFLFGRTKMFPLRVQNGS